MQRQGGGAESHTGDPGAGIVELTLMAGLLTQLEYLEPIRTGAGRLDNVRKTRGINAIDIGSGGTRPAQLPPDLSDFTGRAKEVDLLRKLLDRRRSKKSHAIVISAIAGQGGVGKTTLAIHAAHQVGQMFRDGQLYINLRGPEAEALAPYDVLGGLLRELGVRAEAIPSDLEGRARLYRSRLSGRQVLVVLDNAASPAQVRPLLPGHRSCVVLITSRKRLSALDGVISVRLDVMPEDESLDLLSRLIGRERTRAESESAQRIVTLCGNLPLALRIAGARIASRPHLRLDSFVRQLENASERLSALEIEDLAIRSCFELSYRDLPQPEARVFRRLGLLRFETFTEWVVSATLDEDPVVTKRLLEHLVDAELLEATGPDVANQDRYRLHDLLRDYARELLEAEDDSRDVQLSFKRAATSYDIYCHQADELMHATGSRHNVYTRLSRSRPMTGVRLDLPDLENAHDWFEAERRNLGILVRQAVDRNCPDAAYSLIRSMVTFLEDRSYWTDWEKLEKIALDIAREGHGEQSVATSLYNLGRVHHLLGQWDESIAELSEAETLFRAAGDRSGEAGAVCALGKIYQLGRFEQAIEHFTRSAQIYDDLDARHEAAYVRANLADVYHQLDMHDEALALFDRCMAEFREIGDTWWEANAGIWIADTYRRQERFTEAIDRLRASIQVMESLGDVRRRAVGLVQLGRIYTDAGDRNLAIESFRESLPTLREVGDRWWEVMAIDGLGTAHFKFGELEPALECLEQSLPTLREIGNRHLEEQTARKIEMIRSTIRRI